MYWVKHRFKFSLQGYKLSISYFLILSNRYGMMCQSFFVCVFPKSILFICNFANFIGEGWTVPFDFVFFVISLSGTLIREQRAKGTNLGTQSTKGTKLLIDLGQKRQNCNFFQRAERGHYLNQCIFKASSSVVCVSFIPSLFFVPFLHFYNFCPFDPSCSFCPFTGKSSEQN